jgi:hypothetical protein
MVYFFCFIFLFFKGNCAYAEEQSCPLKVSQKQKSSETIDNKSKQPKKQSKISQNKSSIFFPQADLQAIEKKLKEASN